MSLPKKDTRPFLHNGLVRQARPDKSSGKGKPNDKRVPALIIPIFLHQTQLFRLSAPIKAI